MQRIKSAIVYTFFICRLLVLNISRSAFVVIFMMCEVPPEQQVSTLTLSVQVEGFTSEFDFTIDKAYVVDPHTEMEVDLRDFCFLSEIP